MTTNVNTPLNKTLGYKVSTIDLCPNLALCGQNDTRLGRSGPVLPTQTGLRCIHALI